MPTFGLIFPVQPGKEALVREVSIELKRRRAEYEESRARGGVSVERAYLQRNPDGNSLVLAYLELDRGFGEAMEILRGSSAPIDRYFIDKNSEICGMDFRAGPLGPDPEMVSQWIAPGNTARARGLAFAAPLQPGKTDEARAFAREYSITRRDQMTESRVAKRMTREEVYLNHTPQGDMVVVYLEGEDPVEANREFARSNSPFDRWFKDRCKDIFPSYVDFDQPVPANEEIFSWVRAKSPALS